jgi:hypothetical protein
MQTLLIAARRYMPRLLVAALIAGCGLGCSGASTSSTNPAGATSSTNSTGTDSTGTDSTGTNSTGTNSTGTNSTGTNSPGTSPGTAPEGPGSSTHAGDAQFCSSHSCIPNFPNGNGYVVQCVDGEWSHSGGLSGACSDHGGET